MTKELKYYDGRMSRSTYSLLCSICSKTFTRPNHLKTHELIHKGENISSTRIAVGVVTVKGIWQGTLRHILHILSLLLATRQLFVLAKTLFGALNVTTHLFVMDVQFLALVSMGHDTYSAGAILLWAIHVPVMLLHHYVCLLHPCGGIEFMGHMFMSSYLVVV